MNTPANWLWAKQGDHNETLLHHMQATNEAAQKLTHNWLAPWLQTHLQAELGPNYATVIGYVAGLHDIGKTSPTFQTQQHDPQPNQFILNHRQRLQEVGLHAQPGRRNRWARHEHTSATILSEGPLNPLAPIGQQWLPTTALTHHGYGDLPPTLRRTTDPTPPAWKQLQQDVWQTYNTLVGGAPDLPDTLPATTTLLLCGITVAADHVASAHKIGQIRDWQPGALIVLPHADKQSPLPNPTQKRLWEHLNEVGVTPQPHAPLRLLNAANHALAPLQAQFEDSDEALLSDLEWWRQQVGAPPTKGVPPNPGVVGTLLTTGKLGHLVGLLTTNPRRADTPPLARGTQAPTLAVPDPR